MSEQAVADSTGRWWPADRMFATRPAPFRWREVSRRAVAVLAGLVVVRALVYVALGAELILDDYSILAAIRVNGLAEAAPSLQWGRPVAWLADTVIYGAVGAHPLVLFTVITLLNLLAVVLLYLVLGRFVRTRTAFFVAAVWVLAANHNTLTVWTATAPTVIAVILLLAGVLALTNGRWVAAAVLLALSVLAYELMFPAALAAVLLLPSSRPLGWRPRLVMTGAVLAAIGIVALDPLKPPAYEPPGLALFWRAHFSDGLLGTATAPTRLVQYLGDLALVGVVACGVLWLLGRRGRDDGPGLALTGVVVMGLGSMAVVSLGLGEEGLGMSDRLLALTSIGAAMVLVGVLQLAAHHARAAAVVAAVVLVAVMAAGQFVSLRAWSQAGEDVVALHEFVDAIADPSADTPVNVAVGPDLHLHHGVLGVTSDSGSAEAAYEHRFGEGAGELRVVTSARELLVAVTPGELVLDWSWIEEGAVFDEGVGFVAAVTVPGPGQAMFYGWVEDGGPDSEPVEVELLVDGEPVATVTADAERGDLAQALGRPNPNHAFEQAIEVPAGDHTVCARTVGHGDVTLGCEDVEIQPGGIPVGALESATVVSPGTVEVRGWAADPSAGTEPIDVEVTVGPATQSTAADQSRPDIEPALGFEGGPDHGFAVQVPVGAGDFTVCAVARNVGEGDDLPLGACLPVSVP